MILDFKQLILQHDNFLRSCIYIKELYALLAAHLSIDNTILLAAIDTQRELAVMQFFLVRKLKLFTLKRGAFKLME